MAFLFDNHVLDIDRRELKRGAEQIALEPQVFDLLTYLVKNRDRVVTKDDLIAGVWSGRIVSDSTLTSRINAARRAVGDTGDDQRVIRTYPRKGFRFVGEAQEETRAVDLAPAEATVAIAPPGGRGKPCLAVLPFVNLSGDPEQEYFSDGVTEDIMTALSRHRSLLVVARNSTFAFKGHGNDVRRIGRELGADYIVEGSVRRSGRRVRITAQLAETEGGRHLWAERYDRGLEDVFEVQDEITATIAARLEPEIGNAERERSQRKPRQAFDAWDFFRLGTKRFYASTADENREAQRLFRRAIELDPELAQAHGFLAYSIVLGMIYFDVEPEKDRLEEAVAIARKGVELDERDALVRFMYGRALLARCSYGEALAELESALEMNPTLAAVYCGLGDSLAYEGRIDEAIPYFERAIALSPHDPLRWAFYAYGALARIFAREFDEAAQWSLKATRVPNCHYWGFAHRVAALGHLQRAPELAAALADLNQRKPDFSTSFAKRRLFFVKNPEQLGVYIEGLRKAGVRE